MHKPLERKKWGANERSSQSQAKVQISIKKKKIKTYIKKQHPAMRDELALSFCSTYLLAAILNSLV